MHVWNSSTGNGDSTLRSKQRHDLPFNLDNSWTSGVNDFSEVPRLQKKVDNLFGEFVEYTTLPGVSHVFKRPKLKWKLFWMTVSLSATVMAIYQSWPILNEFIEGKTVQSTSYSADFDFPAVTVCSNIRFVKKGNVTDFDMNYDPSDPASVARLVEFAQRRELTINKTSTRLVPNKCSYYRTEYSKTSTIDDLYYFQTAYYGNCVTFNMGTNNRKKGRPNNNLQMRFSMEKRQRQFEYNENYIQLWLHPPASAPVLYRSEGTRVYPGDTVEIRFEMKHIKRLPRRGSECLDPYSEKLRLASIFYTNQTKYLYTTKACIYSLLFETKMEQYKCLDPAIPKNFKWESLWRTEQYNICIPGSNIPKDNNTAKVHKDDNTDRKEEVSDDVDLNDKFNFDANCTLPCSEWMIDFTATTTSAWFEAVVAEAIREKNRTHKSRDVKWESASAEIKIGLGATMVEMVDEDYRYKPGDFAGIIGGNIGFWIGLCAISLAEVAELGIRVFSTTWKRLLFGSQEDQHPNNKRATRIIQVKGPRQ